MPRTGFSPTLPALGLGLLYLVVAAILMPAYGPTWDTPIGPGPYGERLLSYLATGDPTVLELGGPEPTTPIRQPHPDFSVRRSHWYQEFPVAALLSALSCRLLWTELGLVPAVSAHQWVGPVLVAVLLVVLVRFVGRRAGLPAGLAAGVALVLSPRFFAHGFNNLKDLPEACLYCFAAVAGYRALVGGELRWWAATGGLTALALAQKPNVLFLPVHLGLWLLLSRWMARTEPDDGEDRGPRLEWRGLALAAVVSPIVYLAVSPALWPDPIGRAATHFGWIFQIGTAYFLDPGDLTSSVERSWAIDFSGVGHLLSTTPPAVLVLAAVGALARGVDRSFRIFLILGVGVPLGRTALMTRSYDGVRLFLEFYPFLCALGGLGCAAILARCQAFLRRRWPNRGYVGLGTAALGSVLLALLLFPTIRTHPHGNVYYNFLVGGLRGAQAREIPGATDYWASSYWQGMAWLNRHAEKGAALHVPVAGHLVASAAPVRLRPDIRLGRLGPAPLYVMYVTRREWYGPAQRQIDRQLSPRYQIQVQGAPILKILRIGRELDRARGYSALLRKERRARVALERIAGWAHGHPERRSAIEPFLRRPEVAAAADARGRLRAVLPEELHDAIQPALWLLGDDPP